MMFKGNVSRRLMPQEKKRIKSELEFEKFKLSMMEYNGKKEDMCRINEKLKIINQNMKKSSFTYNDFITKSHKKVCKFR